MSVVEIQKNRTPALISAPRNPVDSVKPDGAKRIRTADPLHAMQVLYQLSYGPR